VKKSYLVIPGLFLLIYLVPLGVRPIIIPDEFRYAEIAREMISSGDWVVPQLNGLRYFEKPVLGSWLNALAISLFGENAFAIRFPSAMAAGISALLIFLLVQHFAEGYSAGIFAAAVFLTSQEVFGVGTCSVLDTVLTLFVTGSMVSFFFAYRENRPGRKMGLLILVGILCGLAFLTKGFVAFAIPAVAVVPFLIWERRWRELFRLPWVPILAALVVVLPWTVLIHHREPDFWHYFFWTEHIRRFLSPHNSQHSEAFWYFIPVLVGAALPWTVLLPAAVSGVGRARLHHAFIRFAICWFLFPFLFFSFSSGKLATYILPCFPPLAVLMAVGLRYYFEEGKKRAFSGGVLLLAVLIGLASLTLVVSQIAGFPGLVAYGPAETWKWVLGAFGFLAWSALLVLAFKSSDFRRKLGCFCAAPLLFMFVASFLMPDQVKQRIAPGEFLLDHADRIRPDTVIVSDKHLVAAVCWCYKRNDVYLFDAAGELSYGLNYQEARRRLLTVDQLQDLITKASPTGCVILIITQKRYLKYRHLLPKPVFADLDGYFVFAPFVNHEERKPCRQAERSEQKVHFGLVTQKAGQSQ